MRVFNKGKCQVKGFSEDYAFFVQALIDLYEATFEIDWLKEADVLNREMIRQFWDEDQGGFFFAGKENEPLIARSKNPYDHVTPSSNSVAVFNLMRLSHLTGEESLKQKAEQLFQVFYGLISEHPSGFSHMLSGLSFFFGPEEIGIVGPKKDPKIKSMIREIHLTYLPDQILSFKDPQEPVEGDWFPFLREKGVVNVPTAFVCKGSTCLPPVGDEKELKKILVG